MFQELMDFAGQIGKAAGPVSNILSLFGGGGGAKPQRPPVPAAESYAISLLKAIAQPGNSLVKSLAAEEFQKLFGAQQQDIRSKVLADRRERSMGRAPVYFDPERQDEAISFQNSRSAPQIQQMAQENAIKRIMDAAGIGEKFAPMATAREKTYQDRIGVQNESKMNKQPIGSSIEELLKVFQGFNKPAVNQPPEAVDYSGYNPNELLTNQFWGGV